MFMMVTMILVYLLGITLSTGAETDVSLPARLTFVFTRPKDNPMTQWLILIYTEALRRVNIGFEFKDVPPKRASYYSDNADVDGELGRIYDYSDTHPNMIRVEEHTQVVFFSAFAAVPDLTLKGWESLQGTNYKVEYRRGIQKSKVRLSPVVPPDHLSDITTVHQGIQKLLAGRTDVYVDVDNVVVQYMKSGKFKEISKGRTVYKAGVMERITAHAFLHKKHQAIVPKLADVLRKMKEEGLFKTYRDQVGLTSDDAEW
jgi:hypothetical protein